MLRTSEGRFRQYAGYLFDLDGTLIDSAPDLTFALNHALAEFGFAGVDVAVARNWVGQGARSALERAVAHRGAPADAVDAMLASFLACYRNRIAVESKPYGEVEETLAALVGRGAKLAVVTNKRGELTSKLLAEIGFASHFDAVVAGDTAPRPKPAPDPALAACAALGLGVDEVLFVGDSLADVGCARAAGCAVVCVAYGYRQGVAAADLGADAVIESFRDLL